jgi:hypothetical protein
VLRQKRRAVSPYKRPDNCNGDGGKFGQPLSSQTDFKDDDGSPVFAHVSRYRNAVSGMLCSLE